ncbi:MAG: adenosylcobinamide-GDP ribazoletransferase [Peptostreptococcaceae bacterium]
MKRFILILQFMTRIPININVGFDEDFHKSLAYFPLVGLVLGILELLIGKVSLMIFDPFITSLVVTLSAVMLTGGLHIDGLGDTFDALYSYRDKEKMLEIMKDSRLGTNSLLAVMFLLLFKIGFIYSLINKGFLWLVIFMPILGRLGVLVLTYKTVTPRKNGLGNLFIGKCSSGMFLTATSYSLVMLCLISKLIFKSSDLVMISLLISIPVIFICNIIFKGHVYKKIDGVTGDILGCSIESSELIYLIYMYIALNFIA